MRAVILLLMAICAPAQTMRVGTFGLVRHQFDPPGVYLSADGSDENSGTYSSPWRTLVKLEESVQDGDEVYLRGGDTFQGSLELIGKTNITLASYGAGRATISGGTNISGWTLVRENLWRASLAPLAAKPRAVFVDGLRCSRARRGSGLPSGSESGTTFTGTGGYLSTEPNQSDIEFLFRHDWIEPRVSVESVSGSTIQMAPRAYSNLVARMTGNGWSRTVTDVENVWSNFTNAMTAGTFYYHTAESNLYLVPPAGLYPTNSTVTVPVHDTPLRIVNSTGITVTNVTVSHAANSWIQGPEGFAELQASAVTTTTNWLGALEAIPAAIIVSNANDVTFGRVAIEKNTSHAIHWDGRSTNGLMLGAVVRENSASGILIGRPAFDMASVSNSPVGTVVRSCAIVTNGVEFPAACAITVHFGRGTDLRNNTVREQRYSGISVGWGWDRIDPGTVNADILVRSNSVSRTMLVLKDGGAIYMNSRFTNTLCIGNFAFTNGWGGTSQPIHSFYSDDGTKGLSWSNCVGASLSGDWHCWNNNNDGPVILSVTVDNSTSGSGISNGDGSGNVYDVTVVSTAAALAAGAALNAGVEPEFADILQ